MTVVAERVSLGREPGIRPTTMSSAESVGYRVGTGADALCVSVLATQVFLDTYAAEGIRPDLAREVLSGYSVEAFTARLAAHATTFILAERNGHLLGSAEVTSHRPCPSSADVGDVELVRLYVLRPFQRMGIGRQLLRHAELEASKAGAATLWLAVWALNETALAFYRRHGYETVGTSEHVFEDRTYKTKILAKGLRATCAARATNPRDAA